MCKTFCITSAHDSATVSSPGRMKPNSSIQQSPPSARARAPASIEQFALLSAFAIETVRPAAVELIPDVMIALGAA
eukprot:31467-Pelagococcus_subviridis.AAC.1